MAALDAYRAACTRIAAELMQSPEQSQFKRARDYAAVVGNDTRKAGIAAAFLSELKAKHSVQDIAARVAANDRYGAPVTHGLEGGAFSAGSLRFLQVADEIGDAPAVLEIGGGYGGQRLLCAHIADYTIVDLPEAIRVAKAYLALHKVPTRFVYSTCDVGVAVGVTPNSFFLSDYALSELSDAEQARYMSALVAKCQRGRITCRDIHRAAVERRLRRLFPHVSVEPEYPATSRHANIVLRFRQYASSPSLEITPAIRERTRRTFAERLQSTAPWSFSRWGDGEWSAVLGVGTVNCDGQAYDPLRDDLRRILKSVPSYTLGMQPLAVMRFEKKISDWLGQHCLSVSWVNADVFHDLSISGELVEFVKPLARRNVVLVGPEHLRALSGVLPYVEFVQIPERNAYAELDSIRAGIAHALDRCGSDAVVALSAGMPANILVHEFAGKATCIDFGSVWEPYVGRTNRNYHRAILEREAL